MSINSKALVTFDGILYFKFKDLNLRFNPCRGGPQQVAPLATLKLANCGNFFNVARLLTAPLLQSLLYNCFAKAKLKIEYKHNKKASIMC